MADETVADLEARLREHVAQMDKLPDGADLFNAEQERQRIVCALWRAKGWGVPVF